MDAIIVTGAFGGLGRAIVDAISKQKPNLHIILGDIVSDENSLFFEAVVNRGASASKYSLDIRSEKSVQSFFQHVGASGHNVIGAINNAGVGQPLMSSSKISEELWTNVIDTNLNGTWRCMVKEIELFKNSGSGRIINIASVAGLIGSPGLAAYAASKAAIVSLTKSASLELAKTDIRINAICPGFIDAGMTETILKPNSREAEYFQSRIPDPRLIATDEFVSTLMWLLFEAPKAIMGQSIVIDNGLSIQ